MHSIRFANLIATFPNERGPGHQMATQTPTRKGGSWKRRRPSTQPRQNENCAKWASRSIELLTRHQDGRGFADEGESLFAALISSLMPSLPGKVLRRGKDFPLDDGNVHRSLGGVSNSRFRWNERPSLLGGVSYRNLLTLGGGMGPLSRRRCGGRKFGQQRTSSRYGKNTRNSRRLSMVPTGWPLHASARDATPISCHWMLLGGGSGDFGGWRIVDPITGLSRGRRGRPAGAVALGAVYREAGPSNVGDGPFITLPLLACQYREEMGPIDDRM